MIDIAYITRRLNETRLKYAGSALSKTEWTLLIRELTSYQGLSSLLVKEGFITIDGDEVYFSAVPIHVNTVDFLISSLRKKQYEYTKRYYQKRKEEAEEQELSSAINLLKSKGYVIIKPEMIV